METIAVYGDYIQLDQLLKKIDAISSGGETGAYLARHQVKLNGNPVHEKRKKIIRLMKFFVQKKWLTYLASTIVSQNHVMD